MENIYEKKTRKGLIRAKVSVENNVINNIIIEGDFFIYPEDEIWEIEEYLKNTPVDENVLKNKIYEKMKNTEFVGSDISDFFEVIFKAARGVKDE